MNPNVGDKQSLFPLFCCKWGNKCAVEAKGSGWLQTTPGSLSLSLQVPWLRSRERGQECWGGGLRLPTKTTAGVSRRRGLPAVVFGKGCQTLRNYSQCHVIPDEGSVGGGHGDRRGRWASTPC